MRKLIILRGLPGSGKSTMAMKFLNEAVYVDGADKAILSTDDYFVSRNGVYKFIPQEIGKAHAWNQERVRQVMYTEMEIVIVDNTNTQKWEMKPYLDMAEKYGYEVEYVMPDTSWAWDVEECARRNTHGVPFATIQGMKDRFQPDATVEKVLASVNPFTHK